MSKSGFRDLCCFRSEKSRTPSPPPQTRSSPSKQVVTKENGRQSQTQENSVQSVTVTHNNQSVPDTQVSPPPAVDCSGDKIQDVQPTAAVTSEEVQLDVSSDRRTSSSPSTDGTSAAIIASARTDSDQSALKSPVSECSLPADFDPTSPEVVESLLIEAKRVLASGKLTAAMEAQISSLVKRLEAVTNRLESVAAKTSAPGSAGSGKCKHHVSTCYNF